MNEASIFLFVFFLVTPPPLSFTATPTPLVIIVSRKKRQAIYILERNGIASHARLKKCKKKEEMKESS